MLVVVVVVAMVVAVIVYGSLGGSCNGDGDGVHASFWLCFCDCVGVFWTDGNQHHPFDSNQHSCCSSSRHF